MIAEVTPYNRRRFILVSDFWEAYNTFELKQTTSIPEIDGTIRPQVKSALKNAVGDFESISPAQLRNKVRYTLPEDAYVITLEGGCVFSRYDYSIEITRACTQVKHAAVGPYIRVPRPLAAHLSQQFLNLKVDFEKSGKNYVVLCDDGIGTSSTIKRILSGLHDVGITVQKVVTITNPNNKSDINGIEVNTLYRSNEEYNWLNERDLYWGLPRSGLSTCFDGSFVGLGGIPYTINKNMVISRIGIDPEKAEQFRQTCINANMTFWKILEKFHGRRLEIRDCGRLGFFSKMYDETEEVLNILHKCKSQDILLDGCIDYEETTC